MNYRILLVEDDPQIREIIRDYFSAQKEDEIELTCARDGEEGEERIAEAQYDLAILDVMLPGVDGFELCRRIRKTNMVSVIFLTAKGREEDKLRGYLLGCDDYVVKPFSLAVLYAKVQALIKRDKGMVLSCVLHVGDIELDVARCTVKVKGKAIELPPKEQALLRCLMEKKGHVFSRDELLDRVWGYDFEGTDRVVDNHVKKLRGHLGTAGRQIKTVMKKGYKMEEGTDESKREIRRRKQADTM